MACRRDTKRPISYRHHSNLHLCFVAKASGLLYYNENSLLLLDMSAKQFLLIATLAYTALAQNDPTTISCSGPIDTQCRKNKGTAACSFVLLGTGLSGNCLPAAGVSLNSHLTTPAREHCSYYDTAEWCVLEASLMAGF